MNTIEQQQAAIKRNQARIIDLLQWDASTYSSNLYNTGQQYLEAYVGKDEVVKDVLSKSIVFWNWFKNLFNIRDEAFVQEWDGWEDQVEVEDLRTFYADVHNASVLAAEIKPPKEVYGNNIVKIEMPAE